MDPRAMMGHAPEMKVPVPVRHWNGAKLALWRSKVGWEIAVREAFDIVARCRHEEGCPGKDIETEPCFQGCPDREIRMSALVVLNAGRAFAPIDARKLAADQYFAPSREFYSEVIAEFLSTQIERDVLLELLKKAGVEVPEPSKNDAPTLAPGQTTPQLVAAAAPKEPTP